MCHAQVMLAKVTQQLPMAEHALDCGIESEEIKLKEEMLLGYVF